MGLFQWDDAKVLLEVSRRHTLRAAGRALGLDASTVLRKLVRLEARLGSPLFFKKGNGYQPTELGVQALVAATGMGQHALNLERLSAAPIAELRGTVRISSPEAFGSAVVTPLLKRIQQQFQDIAFELTASNRVDDLGRRETDLALRLNRPTETVAVAKKLAQVHSSIVAGHSYRLDQPSDKWVWDRASESQSVEARWLRQHVDTPRIVFASDSTHARRSAVQAGLGISFLPNYLTTSPSDVLRLSNFPPLPPRDLWLVVHREEKRRVPVRAIANALSEALQAEAATLNQ